MLLDRLYLEEGAPYLLVVTRKKTRGEDDDKSLVRHRLPDNQKALQRSKHRTRIWCNPNKFSLHTSSLSTLAVNDSNWRDTQKIYCGPGSRMSSSSVASAPVEFVALW